MKPKFKRGLMNTIRHNAQNVIESTVYHQPTKAASWIFTNQKNSVMNEIESYTNQENLICVLVAVVISVFCYYSFVSYNGVSLDKKQLIKEKKMKQMAAGGGSGIKVPPVKKKTGASPKKKSPNKTSYSKKTK